MAASINNGWVNFRTSNFMTNYTNKIAANVTRLAGNTKFASGADNPAGFSFAQRTRSSAMTVNAVAENIQNGQARFKIADAAYGSMIDMLSQAKDIAAQAAGGESADATSANSAIAALYASASKVSEAATFNGVSVFGANGISIEIGGDYSATVIPSLTNPSNDISTVPAIVVGDSTATPAVAAVTASNVVTAIQGHIDTLLGYQSTAGAWESALGYISDFVSSKAGYMQEAATNASAVNITTEMSDYVSNQIALQSAQFIAAQQNQNAYSVLNLLK